MSDLQTQMKQAVAEAAVAQIRDGMVVGLGSGSTAALMIQGLGARLAAGQLHDIGRGDHFVSRRSSCR